MRSKRFALGCIVLGVFGLAGLSVGYKANERAKLKPLPRSGWTVGFHAYRMGGYKDLPVKVYGVRSAGESGLEAVHINSAKAEHIVTRLRIKWFVCEKGKTSVLAKGETPLLDIPGLLGAQPRFDVAVPDVNLDRIMRPVMKDGKLRGDFDVEVVVAEVQYIGGSFWKLPEPTNLVIDAMKTHHSVLDQCDGQTCRLAPELFSYQCADTSGENCTNLGYKCESYLCYLDN